VLTYAISGNVVAMVASVNSVNNILEAIWQTSGSEFLINPEIRIRTRITFG